MDGGNWNDEVQWRREQDRGERVETNTKEERDSNNTTITLNSGLSHPTLWELKWEREKKRKRSLPLFLAKRAPTKLLSAKAALWERRGATQDCCATNNNPSLTQRLFRLRTVKEVSSLFLCSTHCSQLFTANHTRTRIDGGEKHWKDY